MYMEVLRAIAGIEIYPIISLLIFVTFFSLVLVWACRADGARLDRIAALPLQDEPSAQARTAGASAAEGRAL